jgi:hypothetical protein
LRVAAVVLGGTNFGWRFAARHGLLGSSLTSRAFWAWAASMPATQRRPTNSARFYSPAGLIQFWKDSPGADFRSSFGVNLIIPQGEIRNTGSTAPSPGTLGNFKDNPATSRPLRLAAFSARVKIAIRFAVSNALITQSN